MVDRSRLPYGPPIRDVIATGDLELMEETASQTRAALGELHAAIAKMRGDGYAQHGPVTPYGQAMRDAIARGDLQELRAVAAAARASLAGISYEVVDEKSAPDVRAALGELRAAIKELEG